MGSRGWESWLEPNNCFWGSCLSPPPTFSYPGLFNWDKPHLNWPMLCCPSNAEEGERKIVLCQLQNSLKFVTSLALRVLSITHVRTALTCAVETSNRFPLLESSCGDDEGKLHALLEDPELKEQALLTDTDTTPEISGWPSVSSLLPLIAIVLNESYSMAFIVSFCLGRMWLPGLQSG